MLFIQVKFNQVCLMSKFVLSAKKTEVGAHCFFTLFLNVLSFTTNNPTKLMLSGRRKKMHLSPRHQLLWIMTSRCCCWPIRTAGVLRLPGSGESLKAWSHWASIHTSPRCACTDICSPVYGSSWWCAGCCPPCSRSGRCSPAQCGRTTGKWGAKIGGEIRREK